MERLTRYFDRYGIQLIVSANSGCYNLDEKETSQVFQHALDARFEELPTERLEYIFSAEEDRCAT
jgi:hypothetical protein